jgi:TRAP-type C4-dicarboxylate transport system permease small subunit
MTVKDNGMQTYSWLERFEKPVNSVSRAFIWVSFAAVISMLLFVTADLVGHKLFRWGVIGVTEIAGLMGLVLVSFSLAWTQASGAHIEIDFITNRLPKRAQTIIATIVSFFSLALFVSVVWQLIDFGLTAQATSQTTSMKHVPISFLTSMLVVCSLLMIAQLLIKFLKSFKGGAK